MSSATFWKKVYQTVSGYSESITEEIVTEILNLSSKQLVAGLLICQGYTKKSFDEWSAESKLEESKKQFVHELSKDFNLDAKVTYAIVCNYLMYDYYGKVTDFWEMTLVGTTVRLKSNIWYFYTGERMFLLKTLRHIFEFSTTTTHKFQSAYNDFLKQIDIKELQDNLIAQYELISREVDCAEFTNSEYFEFWLCRAYREQIETIILLTLTAQHRSFELPQMHQIISRFVLKNFHNDPVWMRYLQQSHMCDVDDLNAVELVMFFVSIEPLWHQDDLREFWQAPRVHELDVMFKMNNQSPRNVIVYLPWLILRIKSLNLREDRIAVSEMHHLDGFAYLKELLERSMFRDSRYADVVYKSIFALFDLIGLIFVDKKPFYVQPGVIDLISECLRRPQLAAICQLARGGIDSFLGLAVQTFPQDFFSLTKVAHALLGLEDQYKDLVHLLNELPSFLTGLHWANRCDDFIVLTEMTRVQRNSDLILMPAGTVGRMYEHFDRRYIVYLFKYSYFAYVELMVDVLLETNHGVARFEEESMLPILAGYKTVLLGIQNCWDMDLNNIGIMRLVKKLDRFMYFMQGKTFDARIVRIYFEIQNALVVHRLVHIEESCSREVLTYFVPKIRLECIGMPNKELLNHTAAFTESVLCTIFKSEENSSDHSMMVVYCELMENVVKLNSNYDNFQFSGVLFLLNNVFLPHQRWEYRNQTQKWRITLACLNIFHHILQKVEQDLNSYESRLFHICKYAFVHDLFVIESFFRLFINDKNHLLYVMERDTNWQNGPVTYYIKAIRTKLALLLLVMKHRKELSADCKLECPLDAVLTHIVKPVASYFTNGYSSVLGELGCRFLEKIAQDSNVQLLALLEMDHYQVQSLFLERLRDPVEGDNVKMAVIDLINVCISSQYGMTAAFFNMKCYMDWGDKNNTVVGDTVCNFMLDYLENIKKSHDYLRSPLQLGILNLLNNLWQNGREKLIEDITKQTNFWPVMFDPLLGDFKQEPEVYSVILRMIASELNITLESGVNAHLIETIRKFVKNEEQIEKWLNYIAESAQKSDEKYVKLLTAWSEFLVLAKQILKDDFNNSVRSKIMIACLNGMNIPLTVSNNSEIALIWAQLYLILMTSWKVLENLENDVITKTCRFLSMSRSHYKYLPAEVKEMTLSIACHTLVDLKAFFDADFELLRMFLDPLGEMIDMEYDYLARELSQMPPKERMDKLKTWLIIIFIVNALFEVENIIDAHIWFIYRNFLANVLTVFPVMLDNRATLSIAKIVGHHLILYAQSPLVDDFTSVDLNQFFQKIIPPSLTVNVSKAVKCGVPDEVREWWEIFMCLVKLNHVLVDSLKEKIVPTCLDAFIDQHESSILEIICLTKFTVDMTALVLVSETLRLMHKLLLFQPHWQLALTTTKLIMTGVRITLSSCILSILGSKKINFFKQTGEELIMLTHVPNEILGNVLNKLIELIFWCSSCLKIARLKLGSLRNMHRLDENQPRMVDVDFSVPRFELSEKPRLTYGMIISLAHYLVKSLNQLSPMTPSAVAVARPPEAKPSEEKADDYTGFMVYMQKSEEVANEHLASYLHGDVSELFTTTTSAVVALLDAQQVRHTLDALMCFLTGEIYFITITLKGDALFSYKRELASELQFFFEYVRKKTNEQYVKISPKSGSVPQYDIDLINRYMVANNADIGVVADNHFLLVLYAYMVNFVKLTS